jgi:hypothetical protein
LLDRQSKDVTEADLICQAIREFLDRQEDIAGSRAHFRKTFQTRIDALEEGLTFRLDVLLALVAHGLAVMLPVFAEQAIPPEELIQAAIVAAVRDAQVIQGQIETMFRRKGRSALFEASNIPGPYTVTVEKVS